MFWQVILIVAFFGGLRHTEAMDLSLEKVRITKDGVIIHHSRAKQRSDKRETVFLIPRSMEQDKTNYAAIVESYISIIKTELGRNKY